MLPTTGFTALTLAALLLTGCVPTAPLATSTPSPAATPVFASEEEALAAAEAAYAEYLAVEDAIAQDGGTDPERLSDFVTSEWLAKEVEVFNEFSKTGRRQVGLTEIADVVLQQLADPGDGTVDLTMYVCADFSDTRFLDASGADVTPPDRPTQATLQVTLEIREAQKFLLAESEPWSADSVC